MLPGLWLNWNKQRQIVRREHLLGKFDMLITYYCIALCI